MTMDVARTLLAIGGYTPGDAPVHDGLAGLTTWWWDGRGIEPAGSANLPSPSFVCWHPTLPLLYAVSELPDGVLTTLAVGVDGTLTPLARTATGGSEPCWVTTDPAGLALLIANYGSGSMAVIGLDGSGVPAGPPVIVQHHGSGPVVDRQQDPHVHQVVPTADGHVLASDLGADRIAEYRIDPRPGGDAGAVTITEVGGVAMPAGSGPRHIALAAGGSTGFVSGELDGTVTVIRRTLDDGTGDGPRWRVGEQVRSSRLDGAQPSQLLLAGEGRWLLVANRGPDTLAVLDTADGLAIRHEVPTGRQPRYFVLDGDVVLLACQAGNAVQMFTLDGATGAPASAGALAPDGPSPLRSPSCIAVRR